MTLTTRNLIPADFDAANEIIMAAFQSPDNFHKELEFYLALEPEGWFIAELDGQPVGMVGAVTYETYAYIGMMVILPSMQRRGIGQVLMGNILKWIEASGCPIVLLDASVAGRPLYEKLDFIHDGETARYFLTGQPVRMPSPAASILISSHNIHPMQSADLQAVIELDTAVVGGNRAKLIRRLFAEFSNRAFVAVDDTGRLTGYVIALERRIGPIIAENITIAEALLATVLTLPFDGTAIVIAPLNDPAIHDILIAYGFEQHRVLPHMRLGGSQHPGRREWLYGQVSFAIG
jgi:predicted N-acetyltransferase YhbS